MTRSHNNIEKKKVIFGGFWRYSAPCKYKSEALVTQFLKYSEPENLYNMKNMQNMHNWSKQSMPGSVVRLAMFILLTAGKSNGFCIAK